MFLISTLEGTTKSNYQYSVRETVRIYSASEITTRVRCFLFAISELPTRYTCRFGCEKQISVNCVYTTHLIKVGLPLLSVSQPEIYRVIGSDLKFYSFPFEKRKS